MNVSEVEVAAPHKHIGKHHGEVRPKEPEYVEAPVLPIVLRGSLMFGLEHEEAVKRYGLWQVTILRRCSVHGTILDPGDSAELTGDIVQMLVMRRDAVVADKRMREETEVINKAVELGLPQKIREIAAFAPRKRDKWGIRLRQDEHAD
jgi:hypothetical protein